MTRREPLLLILFLLLLLLAPSLWLVRAIRVEENENARSQLLLAQDAAESRWLAAREIVHSRLELLSGRASLLREAEQASISEVTGTWPSAQLDALLAAERAALVPESAELTALHLDGSVLASTLHLGAEDRRATEERLELVRIGRGSRRIIDSATGWIALAPLRREDEPPLAVLVLEIPSTYLLELATGGRFPHWTEEGHEVLLDITGRRTDTGEDWSLWEPVEHVRTSGTPWIGTETPPGYEEAWVSIRPLPQSKQVMVSWAPLGHPFPLRPEGIFLLALLVGGGAFYLLRRELFLPVQRILAADAAFREGRSDAARIPPDVHPRGALGKLAESRELLIDRLEEAREEADRRGERYRDLIEACSRLLEAIADEDQLDQAFRFGLEILCRSTSSEYAILLAENPWTERANVLAQIGLDHVPLENIGPSHGMSGCALLRELAPSGRGSAAVTLDDLAMSSTTDPVPLIHREIGPTLVCSSARGQDWDAVVFLGRSRGAATYEPRDELLAQSLVQVFALVLEGGRYAREAHEQRQRYLDLFESAPAGLWELDASRRLRAANTTFLRWTGHPDPIGRPFCELLAKGDRERFRALVEDCYKEREEAIGGRFEIEGKDENRRIEITMVAVLRDGEITGFRGSARSVQREERLERRLRRVQRLEAVAGLANGVAHNFNNTLTAVFATADLIETQDPSNERTKELAQRLRQVSEKAASRVRRLRDFSQTSDLVPQWVRSETLVDGIVELSSLMLRSNVELALRVSRPHVEIWADLRAIHQCVMELVLNADQAMPDGGSLSISVEPLPPEGEAGAHRARIRVEDSGTGMDEATRLRALEPFFTTRDGSGLGLSSVYGIVHQLGGRLELESRVGEGSRVDLILPGRWPEEEQGPESFRGGGESIVFHVADERTRRLAQITFRTLGYEVEAPEPRPAWTDGQVVPDAHVVLADPEDGWANPLVEDLRKAKGETKVLCAEGLLDEVPEGWTPVPRAASLRQIEGTLRRALGEGGAQGEPSR